MHHEFTLHDRLLGWGINISIQKKNVGMEIPMFQNSKGNFNKKSSSANKLEDFM